MAPPKKKQKPVFDLSKISIENLDDEEFKEVRKQGKKDVLKASGKGTKLKDFDSDDRFGNLKSGRPKKKLPPRGSGNYMSQFDKDMNAAKKKGDVKEQTRLMNVKKSIEANKKAAANKKINEGVKKVLKKTKGGPKLGGEFTGPRKNVLKRLNMGGAIMKNRGGMFKGSY
tara:strand:- start:43 stop:552 length:510 start_codon:yes stop_codon:yes gene_type:complete